MSVRVRCVPPPTPPDAERSARALITAVLNADDFESDSSVASVLDEVRLQGDPHEFVLHLIQWAHFAYAEANAVAVDHGAPLVEVSELRQQVIDHGTSPIMASRIAQAISLLDLPSELIAADMTHLIDILLRAFGDPGMVAITTFFAISLVRASKLLGQVSPQGLLVRWFLEADQEE